MKKKEMTFKELNNIVRKQMTEFHSLMGDTIEKLEMTPPDQFRYNAALASALLGFFLQLSKLYKIELPRHGKIYEEEGFKKALDEMIQYVWEQDQERENDSKTH